MNNSDDARQEVLRALAVLDTGQEERFDRITRIAARAFSAPIAFVSLVDSVSLEDQDRQRFKSDMGIEPAQRPEVMAYCHNAIVSPRFTFAPDTTTDPRFSGTLYVKGNQEIRFYAGTPVFSACGRHVLGTLGIIDTKPRHDFDEQQEALTDLADAVSHELAAGMTRDDIQEAFLDLDRERSLHKLVMDKAPALLAVIKPDLTFKLVNAAFARIADTDPEPGMTVEQVLGPERFRQVEPRLRRALRGKTIQFVMHSTDANGTQVSIDVQYVPNFDDAGNVVSVMAVGVDLTRRLRLQTALSALADFGLNTQTNVVKKAADSLERVRDLLGMEFAGIARLGHNGEIALEIYHAPEGAPLKGMQLVRDFARHMISQGTELSIEDADVEYPDTLRLENPMRVRSFAGAPVIVGSRVWGAIGLADRKPRVAGFLDIELQMVRLAASIIAKDVSQSEAAQVIAQREASLHALATTDPLTGLKNRREFMNLLGGEISRVRRYTRDLSLAIVDLDHFKSINDVYGHPAGDAVLVHVASVLQAVMRDADHICRIGGEEFAIILPETSEAGADHAMEKIVARIAELPIAIDGHEIPVTASVGCTMCRQSDTVESLIKRADLALYAAKARGRNQVVMDTSDDQALALFTRH